MKISEALNGVHQLGVETAPFIYFVEQNPTYIDRMRTIFRQVNDGRIQVVTSVVTLTEVLVRPIEVGHQQYQHEYEAMLMDTEHISTLPVDLNVAKRAAYLRATYGLRTPDALQVATAILANCQVFLTNDFAIRRVNEISILILDDLDMDA